MEIPRLVIAAPQGRSGKTTVTLGVCSALAAQGVQVQPFKKGPDYIDPSWLSEAAGYACRSLDPFFSGTPQELLRAFLRGAAGAGSGQPQRLCLVEGNHGLYDGSEWGEPGIDAQAWSASTAEVARLLSSPVILVINTARMSRSVAAMVLGYQNFEPETNIAAVILNNVAQGRHEAKLRQAIERHCKIPVLGAIPRQTALTIPDRHLGLIPLSEQAAGGLPDAIRACQQVAEQHIDLKQLLHIAASAPALPDAAHPFGAAPPSVEPDVRIGVIRDRAFTFYYPENLAALQQAGAQLLFIDSLHDHSLPAIDALVIGGGFPEIFMDELAANTQLLAEIRQAVEDGLPVYAECGGLMLLSQSIRWFERHARMAGVLPFDIEMTGRPVGHGYVLAETTAGNPFFPAGVRLRGHEFHHSRLASFHPDSAQATYRLLRGAGIGSRQDGLVYRNLLASYTHLHSDGSPAWAGALVNRARQYRYGGR